MLRLGVAGSEATIRLEARVLERKRLIGASEPGLVAGVTHLPRLHWLTDLGAEILATGGPEDPHGARREMGDARHVMHRIKIVDTHIALRQWAASAGLVVDWFVTDFEPGSGGLRKPTTIRYDGAHGPRFTPDGLASVLALTGIRGCWYLEIEARTPRRQAPDGVPRQARPAPRSQRAARGRGMGAATEIRRAVPDRLCHAGAAR